MAALGSTHKPFTLTATGVGVTLLSLLLANTTAAQDGVLEEVTVIEKIRSGEYRDDFADSATKTFTHDLDIPQPVDVLNRELLDGQLALNLDQAYRNSASVNVVDPLGHTNIRGFRLNENSGGVLKNGLREVSQGFAFQPLANIEKIEVLKGASSALYGRGEPGGIINLITKRPEREAFTRLTLTAGSDDFYQFNIDSNHPLSERVGLRLNTQINEERSFRDEVEATRHFFAPVISVQINDNQRLIAELELNKFTQTRDMGIAAIDGNLEALPDSRYLGGDTEVDSSIYSLQLTHEWFVNANWALNTKFRLGYDDTSDALFNPVAQNLQGLLNNPLFWQDNAQRIYRTLTTAEDEKNELNLDINLVGEHTWLGLEHGLLFGLNINRRQQERLAFLNYNQTLFTSLGNVNPQLAFFSAVSFVDPFAPQNPESIFLPTLFRTISPALDQLFAFTSATPLETIETDIVSSGVYFQDQIRFNEQWLLLLGFRYDYNRYELDETRLDIPAFIGGQIRSGARVDSAQSDGELVPRAGLVYQPADTVSLYASYGQQYDFALVAADVRPIESDALEYGVKWQLRKGLTASLAYFDIRKTNIVEPGNPLMPEVVDEVESKGFEMSVLGRLSPHWAISANYSHYDAEISADISAPATVGNRARGTPTRSGNIWLQFNAQEYGAQGLSLALGVNHVGARPGDNANSFELPSFTLIDATASYKLRDTLTLRLQLENLANKRWYRGAFSALSVFPGHGTRARLALDYQF